MSGHPAPKGATEEFETVVDVPVPNAPFTSRGIATTAGALVAEAEKASGGAVAWGDFEVMLPGLTPLAAAVLACLHGKSGAFPSVRFAVRTDGGFVLSDPLDLFTLRLSARARRTGNARPCDCGFGGPWAVCPSQSPYCG